MTAPAVAVKWIHQKGALNIGGRMLPGQRPSLCIRTPKHTYCVAVGPPVRALVRPAQEFDIARDGGGAHVLGTVWCLEELGGRVGITPAAFELLSVAKAWVDNPASLSRVDLSHIINEEEFHEMNAETNIVALAKTADPILSSGRASSKPSKRTAKASKAGGKKAKPKQSAGAKKAKPAKSAEGVSYRGARLKVYEAFQASAKTVLDMEPAKRKAWAHKLASKLGVANITVEDYILEFIRVRKG